MTKNDWNRRKGRSSSRIRRSLRFSIYLRDRFRCVYCGYVAPGLSAVFLTLDHVVPVSVGGKHRPDNLVTCCTGCNCSRRDLDIWQWCLLLATAGGTPWDKKGATRIRRRVCAALKRPLNREAGRILAKL